MKKIIFLLSMAVLVTSVTSCRNEDDLTASIFDTTVPAVDSTSATYKFDQWLYDNFVVPYNVDVKYRFDMSASDLNFQLTPADYNRSQLLAHFIRYLFYDVYTKYAGDDFMKLYGPRIFHFIGSSGFSPTTGTEVLGTASGGVKITLYKINEMKPYSPTVNYTDEDVIVLNENYFHTMHHEFSHILHQTKSYPVTFGQVTSGTYDPINWQDRDSVWTHQNGYVTHYASSATYEDFVETLSCIITDTDYRWMNRLINACSMGLRQGDKEDILTLIDSLEIDIDAPGAHWNNFTLYTESEYNDQTGEYESTERYVLDEHRDLSSTVINKEVTAYVPQFRYTKYRTFTSFKNDFLPWVEISPADDLTGANAMLKKISIATDWYTKNWGLYIFLLRHEVAARQKAINDYIRDEVTIYDLD
ncbi:MAG: hypothetical protein IJ064_00955 [Bacteroidaceae bacterium]|nr:hypothetical protein [Bacteroidaceae bacterium]